MTTVTYKDSLSLKSCATPNHIKLLSVLLLLCLFYFFCHSSSAAPNANSDTKEINTPEFKKNDQWTFYLSPYFWLAGLSGHTNVNGSRVNFSSPVSELRHDFDFSLGLRFEANKGLWTLLFDPSYVKITQKPAINGINGKATYQTTISDGGAYYNLFSRPAPSGDYTRLSFELLGAGRIITFHTVIDFLNNSSTASVADTSSVVVPLIGARFKYNFNTKTKTWLNADFGGFQVSHVSSTWSTTIGISYNLTENFDLSLAYKALAVNYSIQAITYNTLLQGPIIACGFSW